MSTVQQAIEVSAPLHTVYEQFASFESYPQFMTGVEQVTQISDDRTHWVMDLDGKRHEFDAQITECSLDERVSWRTMDGPMLGETITLRPMGETRTQVVAQLAADVAALMPSERHAQESLNHRLKTDLASFKRLIEHDTGIAGKGIDPNGQMTGSARMGAAMAGDEAGDLRSPSSVAARAGRTRTGTGGTDSIPIGETTGGRSGQQPTTGGIHNDEERGSAFER